VSVDAGLELRMAPGTTPRGTLDALLVSEWRQQPTTVSCVPLGEDTFQSIQVHGDKDDVAREVLRSKIEAGETFGIRLWFAESEVGGEFLILSSGEVVFSPTINRIRIGARTTDVSWYLARIIPVFEGAGVRIESWTWRETC
jgi:hypothetical protein